MVMKHIKTFEEREWKEDEFQYLLDILNGMMNHAEEILSDYDSWKDDMPVDNVIVDLQEVGTDHSIQLAKQMEEILDLITEWEIEHEKEISKLN